MAALRGQTSLEFVIYLAVSVASLVLSVPLFIEYYSGLVASGASSWFAGFAGMLEAATSAQSASFGAFVPKDVCEPGVLQASAHVYLLGMPSMAFNDSLCRASGSFAVVDVERLVNGTYLVWARR